MHHSHLYFAFGSLLDPNRLDAIAPGAEFRFTAHFPEARLAFVDHHELGPVPTLVEDPGHTVWGAVFAVSDSDAEQIAIYEKSEGRVPGWSPRAVDREGNKHDCLVFVADGSRPTDLHPNLEYLTSMLRGARRWSLPAGWIMALEDLGEDSLLI